MRQLASPPRAPDLLAEQMINDGLLTRFQATNLLKGKWLRFFIGPYKVQDQIGTGAMGAVYLCEHHEMRRQVAIKVLLGAKAKDEAGLQRFHREARAAASLNHPNIVRAFDVAREDHLHYLVMEYVNGVTLREKVHSEGPFSPRETADYLLQAARGLQHAHEAGLVHRDIKPSNLMIDRSGVVKLLDLGLARFVEDECDLTQGAVLGSEAYMAPEQAVDSHSVDHRADIYGLGATFFMLMTGKRPMSEHMGEGPPRPRTPAEAGDFARVLKLLRWMLSHDPAERPQTTAEVVATIENWGWFDTAALQATTTTQSLATTQPDMTPLRPAKGKKAETKFARLEAPEAAADNPKPRPATAPRSAPPPSRSPSRKWVLVAGTVVLSALLGVGGFLLVRTPWKKAPPPRVTPMRVPPRPHPLLP
jgi:serine/threonine protein kinase